MFFEQNQIYTPEKFFTTLCGQYLLTLWQKKYVSIFCAHNGLFRSSTVNVTLPGWNYPIRKTIDKLDTGSGSDRTKMVCKIYKKIMLLDTAWEKDSKKNAIS